MVAQLRAALAVVVLAVLVAGCGAAIAPQVHTESERLPVARGLYEQHEYGLVVEMLNNYATTGTGNADIDQAVYLLGLAYLKQREYASAQTQFERILHDYPESDSATAASYRLGEALFGQSRESDFDQEFTLKAMSQWQGFLQASSDDPWAPLARDGIGKCRERLARKLWRTGDVYVKLKYYEPALFYFRQVITQYDDTQTVGDALIGLAVADAKLGRKDTALVVLHNLEQQFEGRAMGLRAAEVRAKVEKWPAAGDTKTRRHRAIESATPAPQTPAPGASTTNPFAP